MMACRRAVVDNLLFILTFVGVVVGFILGVCLHDANLSSDIVMWIGIPGEVYMRMLKMLILPLIICSVITGTASLDPKCNGRVSVVSLTYIVVSNFIAIILPAVVTLAVQPGHGVTMTNGKASKKRQIMETADVFADLIRNLFPPNIVSACFEQTQTSYTTSLVEEERNITDGNGTITLANVSSLVKVREIGSVQSTNALGLVVCSLVLGMACAAVGESAKPFQQFFRAANDVVTKVLRWLVWVTPVGVASLIAVACLEAADLVEVIQSLGLFSLLVLGCLFVHQIVLVPIAIFILVRTNPFRFLISLGRPWMVSFASASSAIAIPETMEAVQNRVDARISQFVIPFSSTINRDGTCIFMTISIIFISQLSGRILDAGQLILLWILIAIGSMATPSVPSGSLVAIILILGTLGLPSAMIGLLYATEWILDRFRTASNTLGHAHCALVTDHFCHRGLPPLDQQSQQERELMLYRKHSMNVAPPAIDLKYSTT